MTSGADQGRTYKQWRLHRHSGQVTNLRLNSLKVTTESEIQLCPFNYPQGKKKTKLVLLGKTNSFFAFGSNFSFSVIYKGIKSICREKNQ